MNKILLLFSIFIPSLANTAEHTIFAHGIVDGPQQAQRFEDAFATREIIAPEFPDSQPASGWGFNNATYQITSLLGKKVNRNAMFMGQGADIQTISKAVAQIAPTNPIILYGCSRGAATILTYLGQHNPPNIAALVLDACPANLPETMHLKLAQLGIAPSMADRIFSILFPRYNYETAITPESAIVNIKNKNIPILLIHSTCDSVVHHTHALRLYKKFLQAGFTNVHLALIPMGRHGYLLQNPTAQTKYLEAVHSFYQKYNLNHNSNWAQPELLATSISIETINQQIKDYERDIKIKYLLAVKRNVTISGALIMLLSYYLYSAPIPMRYIAQTIWG